jgi:ribosomal-protein-alanine N-acetyltransferase
VTLVEGRVTLRPISMRDRHAWSEVRRANSAWLAPWEATPPRPVQGEVSFRTMVRHLGAEAREGRMLPFVITYDGQLVGQLTVGSIAWGSLCSAHIGYWVDSRYAGRGIVPLSVAMATDYCFTVLGLHRMEVNIRPENAASLRVVEKLGFRSEGMRLRYLHIDGDWRDHLSFALTADEVPEGLRARWRTQQSQQSQE